LNNPAEITQNSFYTETKNKTGKRQKQSIKKTEGKIF